MMELPLIKFNFELFTKQTSSIKIYKAPRISIGLMRFQFLVEANSLALMIVYSKNVSRLNWSNNNNRVVVGLIKFRNIFHFTQKAKERIKNMEFSANIYQINAILISKWRQFTYVIYYIFKKIFRNRIFKATTIMELLLVLNWISKYFFECCCMKRTFVS